MNSLKAINNCRLKIERTKIIIKTYMEMVKILLKYEKFTV